MPCMSVGDNTEYVCGRLTTDIYHRGEKSMQIHHIIQWNRHEYRLFGDVVWVGEVLATVSHQFSTMCIGFDNHFGSLKITNPPQSIDVGGW